MYIIYLCKYTKPYLSGIFIKKCYNVHFTAYFPHKMQIRDYSTNHFGDIDTFYSNLTSKNLNYYEILNISPKSTSDDIKKAFITLAKQYHPDICNDKRSKFIFMKIKQAHDGLQDTNYRKKYDKTLHKSCFVSDVILTDLLDIQFESLESELERLNRYKRYIDNERLDVINDKFFFLKIILGTAATLAFIVYVCLNLPKLVEFEAIKSGKSDVVSGSDFAEEEIVTAFYNPITRRWERIIHPFQAPTPAQLIEYYSQHRPRDSLKLDKIQMPQHKLPILKTTYQATSHPTVLYDPYRQKLVGIDKQL